MSIELQRRTPSERAAYLAGYEAGIREGCRALVTITEATAQVAEAMQTNVALMLALAAAEDTKAT